MKWLLEAVRRVEDVEGGETLNLLLLLSPTRAFPMPGMSHGSQAPWAAPGSSLSLRDAHPGWKCSASRDQCP